MCSEMSNIDKMAIAIRAAQVRWYYKPGVSNVRSGGQNRPSNDSILPHLTALESTESRYFFGLLPVFL